MEKEVQITYRHTTDKRFIIIYCYKLIHLVEWRSKEIVVQANRGI